MFEKKETIFKKKDRETWSAIRKVLKEEGIRSSAGHYLQDSVMACGCGAKLDPRDFGAKGKADHDIYFIKVRADEADRAREVIRRSGLKAEVVDAAPLPDVCHERQQRLDEFRLGYPLLIEAGLILAHRGYHPADICRRLAGGKAGDVVAQRRFFLYVHEQAALVIGERRFCRRSLAKGLPGELVTIEMLLRLGGVGQNLVVAAGDIENDACILFIHDVFSFFFRRLSVVFQP